MMNRHASVSRRVSLVVLASLAWAAGCNSPSRGPGVTPDQRFTKGVSEDIVPAPMPPMSINDPCAVRLHDMCGPLILYWMDHGNLPERLEELAALPGDADPLSFVCPESNLPYVYSPDGIQLTARKARVIIYDAAPSHSGMRWAVVMEEPQPDKPIQTDVRPFPESFFTFQPAAATPQPAGR